MPKLTEHFQLEFVFLGILGHDVVVSCSAGEVVALVPCIDKHKLGAQGTGERSTGPGTVEQYRLGEVPHRSLVHHLRQKKIYDVRVSESK